MVQIMRETGWTYEQYLDTPTWVIGLYVDMLSIESKKQDLEIQQSKRHGR